MFATLKRPGIIQGYIYLSGIKVYSKWVWNSSVFIDLHVISNIYVAICDFGQKFSIVEVGTTDQVVAASKLNRLYSFFTNTALCCACASRVAYESKENWMLWGCCAYYYLGQEVTCTQCTHPRTYIILIEHTLNLISSLLSSNSF